MVSAKTSYYASFVDFAHAKSTALELAFMPPGISLKVTSLPAFSISLHNRWRVFSVLIRHADWVARDDVVQSLRLGELQGVDPTSLRNVLQSLPTLAAARVLLSRSPGDITIADLTGLGVEDTAIANGLMRRLASRNLS